LTQVKIAHLRLVFEATNGRVSQRVSPAPRCSAWVESASATVVEVNGSHAIYVSQPQTVASLIEKAAKGVQAMATR
jgi:hypothetical protein